MKKRALCFYLSGILLLITGIFVGWYLKTHAYTYSAEMKAASKAIFCFGLSLSCFIIAFLSKTVSKPKLFWTLSALIFIITFIASLPFALMPDIPPVRYTYESSDRNFSMYETTSGKTPLDKGITFNDVKHEFKEFKNKNRESANAYLCRTFQKDKRIKWYHLYLWLNYKFGARWNLPYLPPVLQPNSSNAVKQTE